MNQKYGHAHDAISTVDRLPLLIMISVSVGFGIFPMHLYDVVRSGVDPLIVRITEVVPVAQTGDGPGPPSAVVLSETMTTTPVVATKILPTPMLTSQGGGE